MHAIDIRVCPSAADLLREAAAEVVATLAAAVARRGRAAWALAGPAPAQDLLELLESKVLLEGADWSRVERVAVRAPAGTPRLDLIVVALAAGEAEPPLGTVEAATALLLAVGGAAAASAGAAVWASLTGCPPAGPAGEVRPRERLVWILDQAAARAFAGADEEVCR